MAGIDKRGGLARCSACGETIPAGEDRLIGEDDDGEEMQVCVDCCIRAVQALEALLDEIPKLWRKLTEDMNTFLKALEACQKKREEQ